MSETVFYLKLEKYLAQWVTFHLGSPVRFPRSSNENAVIRAFSQRMPAGALPEVASDDMVPIAIPHSLAKPAQAYCYFTARAKEAIKEAIKDLFIRALWADINPIATAKIGLNSLINEWCSLNGINVDYEDTVIKCFYRMRKAYEEAGIRVRDTSRVYKKD